MQGRRKVLGGWTGLLLSFALCATGPAAAETAPEVQPAQEKKAPELWTLEERLEARFDPERQAQRRERRRAELVALGEPPLKAAELTDKYPTDISGALEPEVFLRWELFQHLIHRGFHVSSWARDAFRKQVMIKARPLGFDETLWPTLEKLAIELIQDNQQRSRIAQELNRRLADASQEEREAMLADLQVEKEREEEPSAESISFCRRRAELLGKVRGVHQHADRAASLY